MKSIKDLKIERIKCKKDDPMRSKALEGLIAGSSEIAKKELREVTDADIILYCKRTIKALNKAMESFDQSFPLYSEYQSEINVLEEFLPKEASKVDLAKKIDELVSALPEDKRNMKSMGVIIGKVKGAFGESADMAFVSQTVKAKLS